MNLVAANFTSQNFIAQNSIDMELAPAALDLGIEFDAERPGDAPAREKLLDRAMGRRRKRKTSETLRRGRRPAEGLALCARDGAGSVVGTVRLWHVAVGGRPALLLGPLAVAPELNGLGIGSTLMRLAIAEAARRGHGAILLVGDAPYYARFGFSAEHTGAIAMPGPYEPERLLALELVPGHLAGAAGVIEATGARAESARRWRQAA